MEDIYIGTPNAKQDEFLRCKKKYVAFGGARGGGKSWAVRCKAKLLAQRYPGIRMLLVRRTMPEIEANHLETLRLELAGTAVYRAEERRFVFGNGSVLQFGYCACDRDADRYQGAEYDVIFFDEATQLKEQWMRKLAACVRGVNGFPKRIYYTCNPGGPGHGWVKERFITVAPPMTRVVEEMELPGPDGKKRKMQRDRMFVPATVYDNQELLKNAPGYLASLSMLPEAEKKALLLGDWDSFTGQVFTEWRNDPAHYEDQRWTHVVKPFRIPDWWRVYRGFDWGYAKPFSVGWYAVDGEGRMYRIRELYGIAQDGTPNAGAKMQVAEVAREIKRIESEDENLRGKRIFGVADPAIFQENGGASIGEMMEREGVYWEKGDHTRLAGKMQFHHRLAFDREGRPMLQVFSTCRHFIRTIPALVYDQRDVEDVESKVSEDHIYDECRYVLMLNPIEAREPVKPPAVELDDPLDLHKKPEVKFYRI